MSSSSSPAMMTAFGLYREETNDESFAEAECITHMLPLLEGLRGEKAEEAMENASVLKVVSNLREEGGCPEAVETCVIRWRHQTEDAIRAQMQPILLHYRLQVLFVKERTQRRALEVKETNERVPLVTDYYKTTPVKWRLMGYMGTPHALQMATDSESMCRTAASTVTSVPEAKRERQFLESFMRLEDTAMRKSVTSTPSTPIRYYEEGRRSPCARHSERIPPFSPPPVPLKGTVQEVGQTPESSQVVKEENLDSTLPYVDPAKRE